jgi:hypothetical protein
MKQKTKRLNLIFSATNYVRAVLFILLFSLSGCGQKGDLIRPKAFLADGFSWMTFPQGAINWGDEHWSWSRIRHRHSGVGRNPVALPLDSRTCAEPVEAFAGMTD